MRPTFVLLSTLLLLPSPAASQQPSKPARPPAQKQPLVEPLTPETPWPTEFSEKWADRHWAAEQTMAKMALEQTFADDRQWALFDKLHQETALQQSWSQDHQLGVELELVWGKKGRHLTLPEPSWGQQRGPEDSLYRVARETLNRGEYRRASELFATFLQRYPQSRYGATANYWQAFALYRAGSEADLRKALGLLDELTKQSATAAEDAEVSALRTRLIGTMAARGDAGAAERLRQDANRGAASCDKEDIEVRAAALSALVQNDPDGSLPVLRRILARRDECSVPLRRRAVYLLGKDGNAARVDEVLEIAKNDPSREVRSDAISRLAQIPGEASTTILEQFLTANADEATQRSVIHALRGREDPAAGRIIRRVIEREDLTETIRAEAIRSLASASCCAMYAPRPPSVPGTPPPGKSQGRSQVTLSESDVALLRGVFDKTTSRTVKTAIVETMARAGGAATDAWLIGLVRNSNEDLRFRKAALGRLRRADTPVDDLARLYDALTERELRLTVLQVLADREEPGATDKLIEIAKSGTDPMIRREAISMLARKKDPRTMKLLLELVEN